jgi:hypothetical protein
MSQPQIRSFVRKPFQLGDLLNLNPAHSGGEKFAEEPDPCGSGAVLLR